MCIWCCCCCCKKKEKGSLKTWWACVKINFSFFLSLPLCTLSPFLSLSLLSTSVCTLSPSALRLFVYKQEPDYHSLQLHLHLWKENFYKIEANPQQHFSSFLYILLSTQLLLIEREESEPTELVQDEHSQQMQLEPIWQRFYDSSWCKYYCVLSYSSSYDHFASSALFVDRICCRWRRCAIER